MKIKKFGKEFNVIQYQGQLLGKEIALDTETRLIRSVEDTPDLVITCAYDDKECYIITNKYIKEFLDKHQKHTLIFHNCPFDLAVLTKHTGFQFWDMIESGRIIDTGLLFQLVAIGSRGFTHKKWSLDYVVNLLLQDTLPKDDSIRLTFGDYLNVDGSVDYKRMSKAHYIYACLDPIATFLVYQGLKNQMKELPTGTNLAHMIHLMGHIALYDIHKRGIGVDLPYTNKLRDELQEGMDKEVNILASYGWTRGQKGNQESYNQICDFLGLKLPKTNNGYSMSSEDLETYKENPFVQSLLKYLELEKRKSFLNEMTSERIHPYYETIKNTGRTSSTKPNIQNPPREGGIREAMVPKKDHVFIDCDYGSIEMYTVANHMKHKYGHSVLYDVLQEGRDPHYFAAAIIYDKPESEIAKDQRQAAKIANYGFLANMSEETFVAYASSFGVSFTLDQAKIIKKGWSDAYPEIKQFWKDGFKTRTYVSRTGFVRANCSYTAWLNNHFQGPAAEGAKIAMYFALKSGLNQVAFVHDQIVCEEHKDEAEEKLELLKQIMIDGMKKICDMNIKVDGEIKERYGK